jgi:Fe-S cluster biogenesis protein NfuA
VSDNPLTALQQRMAWIDELVGRLEKSPDPKLRDSARDLVGTLMELHHSALERILQAIVENTTVETADVLLGKLGVDPEVRSVLLLHGLHPAALKTRIEQALDDVRPSLRAHKGDVEFISVVGNTVELKLVGTCNGCPSSTSTFKNLIETAIFDRAPEIEQISVQGIQTP